MLENSTSEIKILLGLTRLQEMCSEDSLKNPQKAIIVIAALMPKYLNNRPIQGFGAALVCLQLKRMANVSTLDVQLRQQLATLFVTGYSFFRLCQFYSH